MNEKLQAHCKKYKQLYLGVGLGLTFAGITYIIMRGRYAVLLRGTDVSVTVRPLKESRTILVAGVESTDSFISGRSIFGSVTNVNNAVTTIHKGIKGHPGFVTRCVETGELFATQGDAARAFGIPEEILSKHLNYGRVLTENVNFERLGTLTLS